MGLLRLEAEEIQPRPPGVLLLLGGCSLGWGLNLIKVGPVQYPLFVHAL